MGIASDGSSGNHDDVKIPDELNALHSDGSRAWCWRAGNQSKR
jgi:hypothetical protein